MTRVRIEELIVEIGCDRSLLEELRAAGLFEAEELPVEEAEELRVAAELMRGLGVNAAGVEVALQLRRRLLALEQRTVRLLRAVLEESERSQP
jgi:hypothetical protein